MGTEKLLLSDETGQDLIEYTLLLMFVLIASMIFMQQTGGSMVPIWSASSSTVANAAGQVS